MGHKTQYMKALTALLATALFVSGCTKSRDASLPEEAQESNFSINEVDSVQSESTASLKTDDRLSTLSLGEAAKATAEKGIVAVTDVEVPARLKYMFKGLEMTGQAGRSYPITLSVDKQFVTAYKIVTDASELSILEKQIAQVKEEVVLQKQLAKTSDNKKVKELVAKLKSVRSEKIAALNNKGTKLLVPLFKFKVSSYGIMQRTKNELNEETSTLRMKTTDWADATHFKMSTNPGDRIPVGLDPASRGDMDRTFVMDRINNKIMSAASLKNEFQIPVNVKDDTKILTLLDVDALHVFEIGQVGKTELTDSQLQQLKQNSAKSNVRACSDEVKKLMPADAQQGCVLVLRYDVPVKYVRPELQAVDYDGNQDAKVTFKDVRAGEAVGLVQIANAVQPKKIESNNELDPRTTIRVSDIKDKEFFFKRTLEDAPVTTPFAPGMAGNLTIVKMDLEEKRLVVRKADNLIAFKSGNTAADVEEVMSFPVKYLKQDKKDASGADYSMARMVPATRVDAEFVEIDWTKNTLSTYASPFSSVYETCFTSVGDLQASEVDMNLDKGSLNFSLGYSATLHPGCMVWEKRVHNDYNGGANYQVAARLVERVSFKLNDGKSDQSFVAQVPFKAQNELGYGVWTIGKMNPTENGLLGREGQEINFPVVHDFRNGRVLKYTVTGLEPTVQIEPEIRKLYKGAVNEIINSWDLAYKQAFKGTKFERQGPFVTVEFSGEDGVSARVGDLNKNILHFENKFNDSHGILGVSQVGYNPRSGIVVADSLIIYAGNLRKFVASYQMKYGTVAEWNDLKEKFKQEALQTLANEKKEEAETQKIAEKAEVEAGPKTAEQKAATLKQLGKRISSWTRNKDKEKPIDPDTLKGLRDLSASVATVKSAASMMKTMGSKNNKFAIPEMESAWMGRVLQSMNENPSMDSVEIEGVLAKEMLISKANTLSALDKESLENKVKVGAMRTKMLANFKHAPGCMLMQTNSLKRNFAKKSFSEALYHELMFTLGHEMGHSQGLTHNFVGSYDKANFNNEDGTESKRQYSSIMDYFDPSTFEWAGLGAYDVRAIRASHLGLFEASPEMIEALTKSGNAAKVLVNGKYITLATIKGSFAKEGWNNFTKRALGKALKPYKYCTDYNLFYEPTCKQFDYGTSVADIVQNMINEYEDSYVTNYHSWDRNGFNIGEASKAYGRTMMTMFYMRQFMDETFYKLILGSDEEKAAEGQDYFRAALKAYMFYNQVIRTPDTQYSFRDPKRIMAVPYKYEELDEKGQATGKVIDDIEMVEGKALQSMQSTEHRVDTVGVEFDKIMAMNFLTMKTFPHYKYYSASFQFSFLDFEKYLLQMSTEDSFFIKTIVSIMMNRLEPTFTNENAKLETIRGEKTTVTMTMKAYAALYSILNLEATTLREKDNFANYFKVGTSLGKAPGDRHSLNHLGANPNSEVRLSYWALDNAVAIQTIVKEAAKKDFLLQNEEAIVSSVAALANAQVYDVLTQGKNTEAVNKAKAALIAKLNDLNKNTDIVTDDEIKERPFLAIENLVDVMMKMNTETIGISVGILSKDAKAIEVAPALAKNYLIVEEQVALFSLHQKGMVQGLTLAGETLSKNEKAAFLKKLGEVAESIASGKNLETSYGLIIKNMDFLSKLTLMTNPEYTR